MYRGTTPTLTFRLPIDTGSITALSLAVAQGGVVRIEKSLADMTLEGTRATSATPPRLTASISQAATGRPAHTTSWTRTASTSPYRPVTGRGR